MPEVAQTLVLPLADIERRHLSAVPSDLEIIRAARPPRVQLAVKRILDVVLAAAGLLVTLPLLLLIAVVIKLDSRGPVMFRQDRIGAGGRSFRIFKFRTMVVGAETALWQDPGLRRRYEANNFKLATGDDPRVTRFGRFLRQSSLDELPQLWNVVRGDMSLVGARPLPHNHFEAIGSAQDRYVAMRPGITGPWQVGGRSNNGHAMAELTNEYVDTWSLSADLVLLVKTIPAVLSRRGAY
jgi:lipopolysaccharide/colanic/teichoic acid biosynthesis glycosyltransferase